MTAASSWQPQLPLELAFIGLMGEQMVAAPAAPIAQPVAVATAPPVAVAPVAVAQTAPVKVAPSPPPMQKRVEQVVNKTAVTPPPPPPPEIEPATDTTPSPPANDQPLTLDAVRGQWREMVVHVGTQMKSLPALLNMGKPIALEGNVIIIGFDYPIFKDKFDKDVKAPPLINQTYSKLLNTTCTVRGVVTSEYAVPVREEEVRELAQELGGAVRIKN